jgi:SRSO17 transposase
MRKSREADAVASGKRFEEYADRLATVFRRKAHAESLRSYCTGLLLEADRKSIEPIAEKLTPDEESVSATHQSLHHFIANAEWNDEAVLQGAREYVLPSITEHASIAAWIIDDTGIPKQGKHSVGVAHQYCGQLGKQARCQVAVTLSVANEDASFPIAYRLYLPQEWAADAERRKRAGIPEEIAFATKQKIALAQIRDALDADVPRGTALADAAYGNDTAFRDTLTRWDVPYVVAVQSNTAVWAPGVEPLPPRAWSGHGRRPTTLRRDDHHCPVSVEQLAMSLPPQSYRTIEWREGTSGALSSRFAAARVRAAHGETHTQRPEEWLLVEWPAGEPKPTKYHLSTLPSSTTRKSLVQIAHLRWRIEHDFLELKNELGLNQFEGRSWRGFHHHATMCIAAYGFLLAERGRFSPSGRPAFAIPQFSSKRRPRGSPEHSPTT